MQPKERSDAELLAATATEPEAFGAFYRRHVRAVLSLLLARTHRPDLAADLCAETFAVALEQRGRFDPARGTARAWLFSLASSRMLDALRRGKVEDRARRRLGMPARELTDAIDRLGNGEEAFFTGQFGGGIDWELGGDPQGGRVARRTLEGTGVFSGQARSDVDTITIATSRDVRTLSPAGPSNSFLAVYPGGLPLGEITVTATFADGSTASEVMPNLDL